MKYDGLTINKESVEKIFPRRDIGDIDLSGYKSPIEAITESVERRVRQEAESQIYEEVRRIGIDVDKGELIKALRYDREQYCEGYRRGYSAGLNMGKWISIDERLPERNGRYLTHCNIEGQSLVCVLYYSRIGSFNEGTVTHWMPLPEPPKEV